VRTYGEKEYRDFLLEMARRSKLSHALGALWGSAFFLALAGAVLLMLCPEPDEWGFWFAIGILLYAIIIVFHGSLAFIRIFKIARKSEVVPAAPK
jgi:hypothetical protein